MEQVAIFHWAQDKIDELTGTTLGERLSRVVIEDEAAAAQYFDGENRAQRRERERRERRAAKKAKV